MDSGGLYFGGPYFGSPYFGGHSFVSGGYFLAKEGIGKVCNAPEGMGFLDHLYSSMGAQTRTDVLPYISLIPVFGHKYLWPGTSTSTLVSPFCHVAFFTRFEKDLVLAYIPPCTALDRTPSSSVRMSISDKGAQVRFPPHSTRESVSFLPPRIASPHTDVPSFFCDMSKFRSE